VWKPKGKAGWLRTADGFAICGFSATRATYLEIARDDGLTPLGAGAQDASVHDGSNFEGSRDLS
jgi:hypothetical protein